MAKASDLSLCTLKLQLIFNKRTMKNLFQKTGQTRAFNQQKRRPKCCIFRGFMLKLNSVGEKTKNIFLADFQKRKEYLWQRIC